MNKYIKYAFALALPTVALSSCDDYLDTMPDNRATLSDEEKIKSILVSAYPSTQCAFVTELSSDNVDDVELQSPDTDRWIDDAYAWKDELEESDESLNEYWASSYIAIASANQAIDAIDQLGGPDASITLSALRGEALLCRAYNHFMLANLFCKHWTQNAAEDLGLPYMTHPETELLPKYERGNLADFYIQIEKDLTEGLERVSDSYYSVPKYHFNQKAAYAFATRFYLYTEQWEKVIDAANKVLGSAPNNMLRDWVTFGTLPVNGSKARENFYIGATANCNLLLQTAQSQIGVAFGPYGAYSRYTHSNYTSENEDARATNVWGSTVRSSITSKYTGGLDKLLFRKTPYLFEYTDPVQNIGYPHTVLAIFTADEALLSRAEAYIMLHRFDEAAADLTIWAKNIAGTNRVLTPDMITTFYNGKTYCYDDDARMASGMKKHLNPEFTIDAEGSTQECMLQCVLAFRRIETLQDGLRWFDIKRYGIEIPRRYMNAAGKPDHITDFLSKDDKRRIFQIPLKVRDAGIQPNER